MNRKQTINIPASLVLELEAWGKTTASLFGKLRQQSGLEPADVPNNQKWYWTEQWQSWEQEADEAIANADYIEFDQVDDLIKYLHSHV